MKKLSLALFMAAASFCSQAQTTTWKADPQHSRVGFTITHLGVTDVNGQFNKFNIIVTTPKADLTDGTFNFSADVSSIDTNVDMRDNHLKSPDFFDVAHYDKITFVSSSVKKVSEKVYTVNGKLTLHGITLPATFEVTYRGLGKNPAANNAEVLGLQVTGTIKRSDYLLGPKFPAPILSDEVIIKVDGEYKK